MVSVATIIRATVPQDQTKAYRSSTEFAGVSDWRMRDTARRAHVAQTRLVFLRSNQFPGAGLTDPSTAQLLSHCYREVSHASAGKRACKPVWPVQSSGAVWPGRWASALIPYPILAPSLISPTVSVDVKHHETKRSR